MDVPGLIESPIGRLVPIRGYDPRHGVEYDHVAFLPEPLPAQLGLEHSTWLAVTRASQALARLDQAGRQVPDPALLRLPLLRREAVSTSALEGTHAAFTDVLEADVSPSAQASPEVREVLNYVYAAELAFAALGDGQPLSVGLLCQVHEVLVRGTKSDGPDAGRLRSGQVVIGPEGCRVEEARFVPPPADERLEGGVRHWEAWLRSATGLPAVGRAALAHYQFETLHPFHDGNGRIGRLVIVLHLMALGELREPLLELSPWFEPRREAYQRQLFEVSRTGDFDPWVRFFAEAIEAQAASTVARIDRLMDLQAGIRQRVHAARVRGVAVRIAEDLIGHPYVRRTWAAETYGVTYPAATAAIGRLVAIGILEEAGGGGYDRLYAATAVLAALSG